MSNNTNPLSGSASGDLVTQAAPQEEVNPRSDRGPVSHSTGILPSHELEHQVRVTKEIFALEPIAKNRRIIERAKGLLMQRQGLSEQVAYEKLRKTAMDKSLKVVDVAQRMLDVADLMG